MIGSLIFWKFIFPFAIVPAIQQLSFDAPLCYFQAS